MKIIRAISLIIGFLFLNLIQILIPIFNLKLYLTELKDVKVYVVNSDGMKEILYTPHNEDSFFLKVVKEYIKLHKNLSSKKLKIKQ